MDIETTAGVPLDLAAEMCPEGDDPATFAALTPPLAIIVCVGLRNSVSRRAFTGEESRIVRAVLPIIAASPRPLVTFNGRRFDLPLLQAAALRHQIEIPAPVVAMLRENRFRPQTHVDMWDMLTNFGGCRGTLRAWCIGLGLGDPKGACDGSDVARLVAEGKIAEVAEYCLSDCDFTMGLYERWVARLPKEGK